MSIIVDRHQTDFLYQQVAQLIRDMKQQGTLQAGQKLPSLRVMAANLAVSVPTIKQAYLELERQGLIEAKSKSGYFLKAMDLLAAKPKRRRMLNQPVAVQKQSLIEQVYDAIHRPGVVPFGIANPIAASPTVKALSRTMRRVMSMSGQSAINYGPMDGFAPLKKQLIYRYLDFGIGVNFDELIITNGAQEALAIALQCVAKPGDVIAIESPTYFGIIELIESLGLKALEIPICSEQGIWLDDLAKALEQHKIVAGVFSTSVNNPVGSFMPEANRAALVALLESHEVVLIEDDVYGDLHFTEQRAKPAQYYSQKGLVITCSSFSKTAAPSYRIGWMIAGRFAKQALRLKRALSCSAPLLNQWTLSEFLASGDYDRNLVRLRQILRSNKERMIHQIQRHFPIETCISDPQGGCVIWIELPVGYDATRLFHEALEHNISITPGSIFSASDKYQRCLRMSYGLTWTLEIEQAIAQLGALLKTRR
ncbi:aminotransferase-like domain-containing protein [Pseudoalteromonas tunicata]|uniref:aminotransferase-like domain-containing protein n=1 Tax=Pseudoalteromonas tunicata TaxID=314281 RepID=UPI00273EE2C4|nr:PLP-dependent aminotransferase family protein [Pseudoalteromonas tunicata]MDP4982828.1 PLP-dependent aminotransferase family protein [Pseudoalteromonas tunicata]MDP5212196.1 PLP-dependent aminotransferase family protein [Pseudoalteromonas tunicata]